MSSSLEDRLKLTHTTDVIGKINQKSRIRWLYRFVFAVVFLALATLLVASANGYMYNPKTRSFEQTGIISLIVSDPPYTLVLDGQSRIVKKKEIRVGNLFSGLHTVKLAKDGYFAWEKSDRLNPGQAIVYTEIRLFRSNSQPLPATEDQKTELLNRSKSNGNDDLDVRGQEIWVRPVT